MAGNLTIQDVRNLFVSFMQKILEKVEELPRIYFLPAVVAIRLVIHIMSLKKWFDNR